MHMYGYEYYGGNGIVGAQVCTCMMLNFNVGMHILHTVLYTFPKVLTRRICPTFNRFFSCVSHPITFVTLMCNLGMIL